MKHCPACNYSFPDFHRVCDFDGTALVPDEVRPSIASAAPPSRFRRFFKYPKSLTSLVLLGLFLISALIAYLASPTQSIPEVKTRRSDSIETKPFRTTPDSDSDELAKADSSNERRQMTSQPVPRVEQSRSSKGRSVSALRTVATGPKKLKDGRRSSTQSSDDNDPKLIAMLKTTWRVLKKPFRF